ncbi:hypothetical protein NL676_017492 [Syzygium grande]|nr:hypothetical protein NL676_017492 [Syzygium grande]
MALPASLTNFLPSSIRPSQPSLSPFGRPRLAAVSPGARFARCALNVEDQDVARRSANWKPSVWDYGFVQSLDADFAVDKYTEQVHRLGLGYHFETEIKDALSSIYNNTEDVQLSDDLYAASLRFRYSGNMDINYRKMCLKGETIVDEAWNFASKHLKDLNLDEVPANVASHVSHALDMPIHWRPNRLEARWFMDMYGKQQDRIPSLLRLAKLDFNLVQSIHRKEVSNVARWWVELGANKMTFCRDRLVEHYFWCCAMVFEPQYTDFREMTTKLTNMVALIDDIYDVYGTLEELELLTDFIVRWDITDIDKLPLTIRACFLALYNTTNEIGYWTMRERGINPIPYMRKVWADECKAYIKEARWYNNGIKPTLKEYMDNAVYSVGGMIVLLGSYFLTTDKLTEEGLDYVSKIPSLMHCSSKILRLNNDLSTSSYELAQGDSFKALECYMNETGSSEEVAKEHIRHLVRETWKRMNRDVFEDNLYPGFGPFLNAVLNLARASQCFCQYGDEHGLSDHETKVHIMSALFEPVPLD